jgi:hypothetical protein
MKNKFVAISCCFKRRAWLLALGVVVCGHTISCGVIAPALKVSVCAFHNEVFSEFDVKDLLSTDLRIV